MPSTGDDPAGWGQARGCLITHEIQMPTLQSPALSCLEHFADLYYEANTWGLHSSNKTSLVSASWNVLLSINFFVLPRTFCPLLSMYSANITLWFPLASFEVILLHFSLYLKLVGCNSAKGYLRLKPSKKNALTARFVKPWQHFPVWGDGSPAT